MFHQKYLLAVFAIFKIAASLPVAENTQPIEMAYNCINAEGNAENNDKSPILLIHGLGGSHKNWMGVDSLLSVRTQRKVCAVDLRNHGDSPWSNQTDIVTLAEDIGHFLDEQGIKKVNIIGHSLGGKIAVHYTLTNPDRVDSMIIEDNRPNDIDYVALVQIDIYFELQKAALNAIPDGSTEDEAKTFIIRYMNKALKTLGTGDLIPERMAGAIPLKLVDGKWRFKHNMELIEEVLKYFYKYLTKSSGLYEGPALFIYGTKSPFKVAEDEENILELFPKAQLVPIEGASHFIHGLFPQFDDEVVKFLNKVN